MWKYDWIDLNKISQRVRENKKEKCDSTIITRFITELSKVLTLPVLQYWNMSKKQGASLFGHNTNLPNSTGPQRWHGSILIKFWKDLKKKQ